MGSAGTTKRGGGDWKYLKQEICRRTVQPFSDVPFVLYVILAIVVLGCLGIWVELIKLALTPKPSNYDGVLTALATFFPALIGSSSLQLILVATEKSDKVLVSFGFFVSSFAIVGVALISVFHRHFPILTLWSCVIFAALAVWLWWFTNGDDPTYKSNPVDTPSGG